LVDLNSAAKQPAGADDMLLSEKFIKRARPHPVGKRRVFFYKIFPALIE
jgi:hypothetical protein